MTAHEAVARFLWQFRHKGGQCRPARPTRDGRGGGNGEPRQARRGSGCIGVRAGHGAVTIRPASQARRAVKIGHASSIARRAGRIVADPAGSGPKSQALPGRSRTEVHLPASNANVEVAFEVSRKALLIWSSCRATLNFDLLTHSPWRFLAD